ncbi:MAG TPA: class I SAM-dependent methyltransferase [Polyangiaceae bacterium]|jgi:SAM-dependent methyltransferase|nr:class I SAM-dependent methyltransferase [Polyangiaceae bacterium]
MNAKFYDELAQDYHLLFADWHASMERQGAWLGDFIRVEWPITVSVLDAACGIGTQALPLAALGYRVTASDISRGAVARAAGEAKIRDLALATKVADLRALSEVHGTFDLVLACDNALPHLLSDVEISGALSECRACVRPGGGVLFSMRDYDAPGSGTEIHGYGVRALPDGRAILFQVWDWDGPHYDLAFYVLKERAGRPLETRVHRARYYALPPARVLELMKAAGFENVRRVDGFVQPVLVGTRPA